MGKMTSRFTIKLEKFHLIPCAVMELLRKVSQGGGRIHPPPGEIGLKATTFGCKLGLSHFSGNHSVC